MRKFFCLKYSQFVLHWLRNFFVYILIVCTPWGEDIFVCIFTVRTPWDEDILLTFEGDCEDEETQRQIQKSTFQSLQDSFVGQQFIASTGLTYEDIHVQCGAKVFV